MVALPVFGGRVRVSLTGTTAKGPAFECQLEPSPPLLGFPLLTLWLICKFSLVCVILHSVRSYYFYKTLKIFELQLIFNFLWLLVIQDSGT